MPSHPVHSDQLHRTRWRTLWLHPANDITAELEASLILLFHKAVAPATAKGNDMFRNTLIAAVIVLAASGITGAGEMEKLPNPLKNAKEGQWVTYIMMDGQAEQTQTLVKIEGTGDDRKLTMKIELKVDGQLQDTQEQTISYKDAVQEQQTAFDDNPDAKISPAKMEVKGAEVDGMVIEFAQEGMECKLFLSDAVPVVGIVKMEVKGMPGLMMELKDFGE